jgi:two-component system chemotaxis response regulator CheB
MSSPANSAQIRVLIVDDSAFMRVSLAQLLNHDPELIVVGSAFDGADALRKIAHLDPDVVTLDVQMPGLNGLQTLRRIMAEFPRPVLMVSSATVKDAEATFDALAAGAFDYVPKQLSAESLEIFHIRDDLIGKIKAAAESHGFNNQQAGRRKPPRASGSLLRKPFSTPALLAIGVSTGGPKALQEILPALPADLPVPILIVQHMPPGFAAPFAERLNKLCAVSVCQASQGQAVRPGKVYVAPAGFHMRVDRLADSTAAIRLSQEAENQLHTPSIDILMQSAAATFHSQTMGIILTGMGSDGSQGMAAIHREGGFTVGQDAATSAVYSMPRACAEMGILDKIVPLQQIPFEILQATHYHQASAS